MNWWAAYLTRGGFLWSNATFLEHQLGISIRIQNGVIPKSKKRHRGSTIPTYCPHKIFRQSDLQAKKNPRLSTFGITMRLLRRQNWEAALSVTGVRLSPASPRGILSYSWAIMKIDYREEYGGNCTRLQTPQGWRLLHSSYVSGRLFDVHFSAAARASGGESKAFTLHGPRRGMAGVGNIAGVAHLARWRELPATDISTETLFDMNANGCLWCRTTQAHLDCNSGCFCSSVRL